MANIIENLFKEPLINGIMGDWGLGGVFEDVNELLNWTANKVGLSPSEFSTEIAEDSGSAVTIFSFIQDVSESVIVPIAGVILTFIACWELIQMVVDQNNFANFDTSVFIKWIFKTAIAILLVTNCFTITMAIFDLASEVISGAGAFMTEFTGFTDEVLEQFEDTLWEKDIGTLLLIFITSYIIRFAVLVLWISVFIVVYGRMIEIYLTVSLAPIPMATFGNKEQSQIGQNYLRTIAALAFQGFLMLLCVGIYALLLYAVTFSDDPLMSCWRLVGYTALLVYSLYRTGTLTKSIFGAH